MRKLSLCVWAFAFTPGWALAQPAASEPQAPVPSVAFPNVFDFAAPQTPLPQAPASPLLPDQALKLALRQQPALFIGPNTLALARTEAQAGLLKLSHSVYRAWIEAVAARQSWGIQREIHEATRVAAELAQRMTKAGNWSKVPLLQAQLLQSDSAIQVAKSQEQSFSAQEKLIKRLGLWGEPARIQLPQQLPDLPGAPLPWTDLEALTLQHKPALTQARSNADGALAQVNPKDLLVLQQTVNNAAAQWPRAAGETPTLAHLPLAHPPCPECLLCPTLRWKKRLLNKPSLKHWRLRPAAKPARPGFATARLSTWPVISAMCLCP